MHHTLGRTAQIPNPAECTLHAFVAVRKISGVYAEVVLDVLTAPPEGGSARQGGLCSPIGLRMTYKPALETLKAEVVANLCLVPACAGSGTPPAAAFRPGLPRPHASPPAVAAPTCRDTDR
ncbi:hypothetical protein Ato02nite_085980 [Paractinoplanes toevensis]|uniref:Uncharacterized protein n=1 Tax=Paractinoplanes toevensis TaxID=571911 RepID=A0A919WAY8_9ACTN|nr:hypothetical protein Ato02nite_085980 [Actinoplanes toevensis]